MGVMSSCCRHSVIYCAYARPIASLLLFPLEQRLSLRDSGIKYVFLNSSKSHNGTLDSSYNTSDSVPPPLDMEKRNFRNEIGTVETRGKMARKGPCIIIIFQNNIKQL